MKFFVTGVGGQLGHDVMNELSSRGHEGVGSDIAPSYSGIADGTPVTTMPYVQLDITDKEAVEKVLTEEAGEEPLHREGYRGGTWVLLDYGCIAIHVFNQEARAFYGLERLWQDGRPVDLTGVVDDHE